MLEVERTGSVVLVDGVFVISNRSVDSVSEFSSGLFVDLLSSEGVQKLSVTVDVVEVVFLGGGE